jgi:hypothetical protein
MFEHLAYSMHCRKCFGAWKEGRQDNACVVEKAFGCTLQAVDLAGGTFRHYVNKLVNYNITVE